MTDLNDLHERAGAEGLDVRVKALTEQDELSEYSKATVTVTLPADGKTVLEAQVGKRERGIQDVIDLAAARCLSGLEDKVQKGTLAEYRDPDDQEDNDD